MLNETATRAAGLEQLAAFSPKMGKQYAARRNFDFGAGQHNSVSCLSPYLRRRLLLESEAVEAALDAYGYEGAEKFIQEVFWRSYFKGWLERRPSVWAHYQHSLAALREKPPSALAQAEAGETGIACFDAWAKELIETGYLHNHARMWFASIWIFTLNLPWQLGADFFLRNLLDGDPASNTLSWRWVAGLHTKGKAYIAQRWNIEKFTDGRFTLPNGVLNEEAEALSEQFDAGPALPPRAPLRFDSSKPFALLLTEEDCAPESLGIDLASAKAVGTLQLSNQRSAHPVNPLVLNYDHAALEDAAQRARKAGAPEAQNFDHPSIAELSDWAAEAGATQIVTAYLPQGPVHDWLMSRRPHLEKSGLALAEIRRDWDEAIWPYASAGFFKVKKVIPSLLDRLSLGRQGSLF